MAVQQVVIAKIIYQNVPIRLALDYEHDIQVSSGNEHIMHKITHIFRNITAVLLCSEELQNLSRILPSMPLNTHPKHPPKQFVARETSYENLNPK
jgi:hypothetical protein